MIAKSKRRRYNIEDVVDICTNGFAFDGMLLIGAVIELLNEKTVSGIGNLIRLMADFQKQLRYGLPNQKAILLYELGFSDRMVSMDLISLFEDVPPHKKGIIPSAQRQ